MRPPATILPVEPNITDSCVSCSHSWFAGVPTFGRCFGFLWPLRGLLVLLPTGGTLLGVAQLAAEVVDLVAQLRGVLELELGRRLVHLFLERLDEAGQFLLRQ